MCTILFKMLNSKIPTNYISYENNQLKLPRNESI